MLEEGWGWKAVLCEECVEGGGKDVVSEGDVRVGLGRETSKGDRMSTDCHGEGIRFTGEDRAVAAAEEGSPPVFSDGTSNASSCKVGCADHACGPRRVYGGLDGCDRVVKMAGRAGGAPVVVGMNGPCVASGVE